LFYPSHEETTRLSILQNIWWGNYLLVASNSLLCSFCYKTITWIHVDFRISNLQWNVPKNKISKQIWHTKK
jgi:hypothetical protein